MPRSKEEAERLGYKIYPIKHSMKRRAVWHDYSRKGVYMITVHIATDEDGRYYGGFYKFPLIECLFLRPIVLPSFGFFLAQTASTFSCNARIAPSITDTLISKISLKSDKANL